LVTVGYALLYMSLFYFASLLDQGGFISSLWYPPAGLTVFGLLAFGGAGIILDAMGSALTLLMAAAWRDSPLSATVLLSGMIIHPLAYAAVFIPLRRRIGAMNAWVQPAHLHYFLIASVLGASMATGVGIARLAVLGDFDEYLRLASIAVTWFIGDLIGILTIAPLLGMMWLPRLRRFLGPDRTLAHRCPPRPNLKMLGPLLMLALMPLILLGVPRWLEFDQYSPFITLFLLLPLAYWVLYSSLSGAVLGVIVLDSSLVVGVTLFDYNSQAFAYQLIMIAIALTGLLLGSVVEERNRARAELEAYAERLAEQVAAQTAQLQAAYRTVAQQERHLSTLIEAAPVGIAELNPVGHCCALNPSGCTLAGCSASFAKGRHFTEFVHPDDVDHLHDLWAEPFTNSGQHHLEFRLARTDRWVAAHWINLVDPNRFIGTILIFIDISERRQLEQQLWNQAHHDGLTNLPNRLLFWERLQQSLCRAQRNQESIGLLWIDLDGFKAVNDYQGHAAGDELLRHVAHRLSTRVRASDTVARMGGDEFAVIVSDLTDPHPVLTIAKDLIALLAEPFVLQSGSSRISASIGIALYPAHAETGQQLVYYADLAMYAAKNAGKSQIHIWQPPASENEGHEGYRQAPRSLPYQR